MSKVTQFSRISHHTIAGSASAGLTFSVPPQEDFTDGSWTPYDLALSEIGVNEQDKRVYIRVDDEIKEFQLLGSTFSGDTLAQVLVNGNTTGGSDIEVSLGDKIISNSNLNVKVDNQFIIKYGLTQSYSILQDFLNTNDNTPDKVDGSGKGFVRLDNVDIVSIDAMVTAISVSSNLVYGSKLFGVFKRSAGIVTQISTTDKYEKTEFTTATSDFVISGNDIWVEATGEIGVDIRWEVVMNYKVLIS